MKGQAEDLHAEVDGVARERALRPAPVGIFADEAGIRAEEEVAAASLDEVEAALFEQRQQGRQAGGADLVTRPSWLCAGRAAGGGVRRAVGHSLSSNGVG